MPPIAIDRALDEAHPAAGHAFGADAHAGASRAAAGVSAVSRRARRQRMRISTSAPTKSRTSAWIISVRLPASSGWKTSGSRLRVDVPLSSAPKSSARERHADRRVPPQQRDRDPDEADRRVLDVDHAEPELPAEHVERAADPRERAGDRHREEIAPPHGDAAVAGRLGVEADRAHLVAERRAVQHHPVDDERRDRDEEADVEPLQHRVAPERPAAWRPRRRRSRPAPTR